MRISKGPSSGPLSVVFSIVLLLLFATAANAADSSAAASLPDLSTVTQPDGKGSSATSVAAKTSDAGKSSAAAKTTAASSAASASAASSASSADSSSASIESFSVTSGPPISSTTGSLSVFHLTGLPTIAGAGIPTIGVPDTAAAPFMQKSNLPDGTVFICVGAALGFMGAAILAWRGLVVWSLHRSVKRAAQAQNLTDSKSMLHGPSGHRGLYTGVGASSTMSLDRLSAVPPKPFSSSNLASAPPKANPSSSSLFFSPTAGASLHSSTNRSSSYLPAGYYASGSSQPAAGAQMTHVGGPAPAPSLLSLGLGPSAAGYTRARSIGISPPGSPNLPPSRGNPYDRPPPSRGESVGYARSSVAGTVGGGGGVYGHGVNSSSNLSLPGGGAAAGGRAPSAYLEDLFENHGNGPRERF
ncbi:hypothetical protein K432DRAFT_402545 [Lepidopterella palustris CBS 459.81]|uniref:Uncharacterized protein n=1 Tax=Lepidopterella palustris CBS 459.81 TaxID=1314670 RepID=A0A8E2JI64_9PEZI|nr:hypothetical protein K432DRAFT_402545 [Lepidopterella palustris CBS 459.81]